MTSKKSAQGDTVPEHSMVDPLEVQKAKLREAIIRQQRGEFEPRVLKAVGVAFFAAGTGLLATSMSSLSEAVWVVLTTWTVSIGLLLAGVVFHGVAGGWPW